MLLSRCETDAHLRKALPVPARGAIGAVLLAAACTAGSQPGQAPAAAMPAVVPAAGAAPAAVPVPRAAAPRAAAPLRAAPAAMPCGRVEIAPVVQIPLGKAAVVRPATPVSRILLGNPDNSRAARPVERSDDKKDDRRDDGADARGESRPGVADVDVLLLGPSEVYLLGKTLGSTNVVMIDRTGTCTAFDVVVSMDVSALQATLTTLMPLEKEVRISAAFDSIVLAGSVTDSEALARVVELAGAYVRTGQSGGGATGANLNRRNPRIVNLLEVGSPQQVMLEVKVAEISKALLDRFGIDFARAYVPGDGSMVRFLNGIFGGALGVLGQISDTNAGVPKSSVDAVVGGAVTGSSGNGTVNSSITSGNVTQSFDSNGRVVYTTTYGTVPGRGVTNTALNMQKTDGMVKVLAEPTVMAISGQTGSFLAGGKIFIPVTQGDATTGGRTVTLEEKEFGVSVRFTPTVLGNGRINLKVRPEVSELNREGVGLSAPGVGGLAVLPSFTSRRAETTVQLMDGQSFAIGGLIKNNVTTNIKAFPLLGELPVLGALFRSTEFQSDRSELVFVITPRLVKPLPLDYRLPTDNYVPPTRSELILEGRMEGREREPDRPADGARVPVPLPPGGGFDVPPQEKK